MQTAHYFIAIPIQPELQNQFSKWQEALKQRTPFRRWYNKKDLHITLKFLGAVEEENVQSLHNQLSQINTMPTFNLEVGTLGYFGNSKQPRVVWAGVKMKKELETLQQNVEQCASKVGYPKETRNYRPHITLAKKWNGKMEDTYNETLMELKDSYTDTFQMEVNHFVLYKIHPSRDVKYEAVFSYPLN